MDQVNLAKVGLVGVDCHTRAMSYSCTKMGIAFDAHTLKHSYFWHQFFGEPMNTIPGNSNYFSYQHGASNQINSELNCRVRKSCLG